MKRYIITKFDEYAEKWSVLKSMSVGDGGFHLRAEWIDMDDAGEYPTAFSVVPRGIADAVAELVGGGVMLVPGYLVGIDDGEEGK